MKGVYSYFALAIITTLLMALPSSAFAQDIVIDSGTDETVISRLPNAGFEEEPVCSDSVDGTLGKCSGALLGFYKVRVQITVTADEAEFGAAREGNCDAGDFPISVGWFANQGNRIEGMSLSENAGGAASVFVRNLSEGSAYGIGINCADFSPAHVEP